MIIGTGMGPGSAIEAYLQVQDGLRPVLLESTPSARPQSTSAGEEPARARRMSMNARLMVMTGVFGAGLIAGKLLW